MNPGELEYEKEDTQENAGKVYLYRAPSIRSSLSAISIHTGKKLHINILCVPLLGGSIFNSDMPVDRNVILQRDLKDRDYMHFITLIMC